MHLQKFSIQFSHEIDEHIKINHVAPQIQHKSTFHENSHLLTEAQTSSSKGGNNDGPKSVHHFVKAFLCEMDAVSFEISGRHQTSECSSSAPSWWLAGKGEVHPKKSEPWVPSCLESVKQYIVHLCRDSVVAVEQVTTGSSFIAWHQLCQHNSLG